MKFSSVAGFFAAAASALAISDDEYIEAVGKHFYYKNNGTQFFIKGVAYQSNSVANETDSSSFTDPLADETTCKRDIPYLQELNTNVIRVYAINTSLSHDACMNAFADAGIYVIADLSEPGLSINRDDPAWNVELYTRYTEAVDALANYTNTLGFFAGNEVVNQANNTNADAYVKAAIRDTKAYISAQGYRSIPVGYAMTDVSGTRMNEARYLVCGDDEDATADFLGLNNYEWCGDSTYTESGYSARTQEFSNLTIPVFFSEYGCNEVTPRTFTEVAALYGDNMTSVWSGGIVYMYFEEENNYGLVTISDNSVTTLTDFSYLSKQMATISPSTTAESAASTSSSVSCPATNSAWAAASQLPPSPDASACACIDNWSPCVVSDDTDSDDYADIFSYVCGEIDCAAITGNSTTGEYGAFVMCDSKQQLNYVLSVYYADQSSAASACDFSGKASTQSTSLGSYCSSISSSVSKDATVVLATSAQAAATATASATGSSSKSSSSGSSSSSSSSNVAAPTQGHMGVAAAAMAVGAAVFAGAF